VIAALALALALAGCKGGSDGGTSAAPAQVQISTSFVFLAGVGQTKTLSASALDSKGQPVHPDITWTSSAPDQIGVDASGKLTALKIGSAQIFAQGGGTTSPPALVVAAEPAAGALLVTDAQVASVGDFLNLPDGQYPALGTQYEVRLSGIATPPAAGTIVLAAERAHVAGRVVATRNEGSVLVVTLETAALPDLMKNVAIDWELDLSAFDAAESTATPTGLVERSKLDSGGGLKLRPFQEFGCNGGISPALVNIQKTFTPSATGTLILRAGFLGGLLGEARVELQSSYDLAYLLKLEVQAGVKGTMTCRVQDLVPIPVDGWLEVVVAPAIQYGVGLDLSAELVAASAELDLQGSVGLALDVGVACPSEGPCIPINSLTPTLKVTPTVRYPSKNDVHAKLSAHLYSFCSFNVVVGGGKVADFEILIGKLGPEQDADLGFEQDQAKRTDYASTYNLKQAGDITISSGIADVLDYLRGKGKGILSPQPSPLTEGRPRAAISTYNQVLAHSPTGTFEVDKKEVGVNQKVMLNVYLDAGNLDYYLLGYNVQSIDIYQLKEGGSDYQPLKSIAATVPEQFHFQAEWDPTVDDLGNNTLVAFVKTGMPVLELEIGPDTQKQVKVSCFPATGVAPGARAGGSRTADTATCEDVWQGSSSSVIGGYMEIDAQVTWKEDVPGTVPGSGRVLYYPVGSVSLKGVTDANGCDYSFNPSVYTLNPSGPDLHNNGGGLTIDHDQTPATYQGQGITQWVGTITKTCPDGTGGSVGPVAMGGNWLYAQGSLEPDELSFHGPQDNLGQTFTYDFLRP
jgi:hypothetical protein